MLSLGSNISATQVVEAKYSINFDGTDEYIDTGQTFQSVFRGDFSISFWMKPDDGRCSEMVFGADNDSDDDGNSGGRAEIYFQLQGDGAPRFIMTANTDGGIWSTNGGGGFNFDNGAASSWTHFVITVDLQSSGDTVVKIYVNGVDKSNEEGSMASSNHDDYTSDINLTLGGRNIEGTVSGFYGGGLDEFAIFNTVLDSDAVTAIYNGGSPLNLKFDQGNYDNSSSLQAYYKMGNGLFDDKANGIIHDQDNPGFGNNLVVNANFSANEAEDQTYLNGGLEFDNWAEQQSSGLRKFELTSDGQGIRCTIETANDSNWNQRIYQDVSSVLTVGDVYEFSVDVLCSLARNFEACIETISGAGDQFTPDDVALSANTRTVIKKVFRCTATSHSGSAMTFHLYPLGDPLPAGEFYEVRNPSLKKLNGKPGLTSGGSTFSSDTP